MDEEILQFKHQTKTNKHIGFQRLDDVQLREKIRISFKKLFEQQN